MNGELGGLRAKEMQPVETSYPSYFLLLAVFMSPSLLPTGPNFVSQGPSYPLLSHLSPHTLSISSREAGPLRGVTR